MMFRALVNYCRYSLLYVLCSLSRFSSQTLPWRYCLKVFMSLFFICLFISCCVELCFMFFFVSRMYVKLGHLEPWVVKSKICTWDSVSSLKNEDGIEQQREKKWRRIWSIRFYCLCSQEGRRKTEKDEGRWNGKRNISTKLKNIKAENITHTEISKQKIDKSNNKHFFSFLNQEFNTEKKNWSSSTSRRLPLSRNHSEHKKTKIE